MRRRYCLSFILLSGIASLFAFVLPSRADFRTIEGVVRKVSDEDTIAVVTRGEKMFHIRLYGIDGPEIRHGKKPGQPFGEESKAALEAMILGKKVRIHIMDTDHYKRTVGIVYVGTLNVNEEMVKQGWAWAYGEYNKGPGKSDFIEDERQAKENKRGLWQQSDPLPPWEYRRRNR